MMVPIVLVLFLSTLVSSRPLSLFQLSFAEVPQKRIQHDFQGATPANTYPLVIRPMNFAPAVKAPKPFLFPWSSFLGLKNFIPGAIPLFAPLRPFPYLQYVPVQTNFYLNEPNVRYPFLDREGSDLPSKAAAPKPSHYPIRDTQVAKVPAVENILNDFEIPQHALPQLPAVTKTNNVKFAEQQRFSGQVRQPSFSIFPFRNSKMSAYLLQPSPMIDFRVNPGRFTTIVDF